MQKSSSLIGATITPLSSIFGSGFLSTGHRIFMAAIAVVLGFITIFAVPAS